MIEVKVYNIKVEDINKSDSNTQGTYPMVEYQFYGFLMDEIQLVNEQNARLKAEVERLKEGNECLDQMHEKEMARSAFLCEEVNRTTAWGRGLESNLSWARAELLMVKAEVERLTAFTTRTIIPSEILQTEVNQLKIELADAQESYHIINEIIASERNANRTNTMMLKDQIDGLHLDNRLLGERVLAYQRLKQLNDISRPPNEA